MKQSLTLKELQHYIMKTDYNPNGKNDYFLKLIEEVGELSEVLRKNKRMTEQDGIKGTIEEELYDVLYYVLALANVYGIDLERSFEMKEEINRLKWNK